MLQIRKFYEYIDTECGEPSLVLPVKAYKVDESKRSIKGTLKRKAGVAQMSGCDYFKYTRNKVSLIEFSHIEKQFNNCSNKYDEYLNICKTSTLDYLVEKDYPTAMNVIVAENQKKIHGSMSMYNLLAFRKSSTYMLARRREITFYLVFCDVEGKNVKMLENLRLRLIRYFGSKLLSIKVLTLKEFQTINF